ncbi:hypothetical protein BD413DRAFT_537397 [Trametes elegans]|nr:hypothetical protein BD413DRAFT_537397 [Trametes elegans]
MPLVHDCALCQGKGPAPTVPCTGKSLTYQAGQVFRIRESIFTPVEEIFSNRGVSNLTGDQPRRSRMSLDSLGTRHRATQNIRPCILMKDVLRPPRVVTNASICLMATYEGQPIEDLRRVMQYLSIPVFPIDPHALDVDGMHLHSHTEWTRAPCWIMAWLYSTKRPLGTRWLTPQARQCATAGQGQLWTESGIVEPACDGMTFNEDAYFELKTQWQARPDQWITSCKKSAFFASGHEKEYREYLEGYRPGSSMIRPHHIAESSELTRSSTRLLRRHRAAPWHTGAWPHQSGASQPLQYLRIGLVHSARTEKTRVCDVSFRRSPRRLPPRST